MWKGFRSEPWEDVDELLRAGEAGVCPSWCPLPVGEAPGGLPLVGGVRSRYAAGDGPTRKAAAASEASGLHTMLSGWLEGDGHT